MQGDAAVDHSDDDAGRALLHPPGERRLDAVVQSAATRPHVAHLREERVVGDVGCGRDLHAQVRLSPQHIGSSFECRGDALGSARAHDLIEDEHIGRGAQRLGAFDVKTDGHGVDHGARTFDAT